MKILFDHSSPFSLAHGGFQIQIEQTKSALEGLGIEVEFVRWWDGTQKGDLIHYFGPITNTYLNLARAIELPVVLTTLFTETCNRSDFTLRAQGRVVRTFLSLPAAEGIKNQLQWKTFTRCSRNVVGLDAEKKVLETVYGVASDAISIVPLGLSSTYLSAGPGSRSGKHLICTGTITERKNSVLLAQMAKQAKVPLLFVGKPYHLADPYWLEFCKLIDGELVIHHPHVDDERDMVHCLQSARGYVLLSRYENWCLSAHEAAACGLPLLVPDQKWSRERFGSAASYFHGLHFPKNVETLRTFYEQCPSLPAPGIDLASWKDTALQLINVYEAVLRTSR